MKLKLIAVAVLDLVAACAIYPPQANALPRWPKNDALALRQTLIPPPTSAVDNFGQNVALGDVDADGALDTAVLSNHFVTVFSGATGGVVYTFTPFDGLPSPGIGLFFSPLVMGDVDADGHDDILFSNAIDFIDNHVWVYSGRTGNLLYTISRPPTAGLQFGNALALVRGTAGLQLLVGSPLDTVDGTERQGRVYVYSARHGTALGNFTSVHPQDAGLFGYSIASSAPSRGRTLFAVGAMGETAGTNAGSGNVYVYDGPRREVSATLSSPEARDGYLFGTKLAIADAGGGRQIVAVSSLNPGTFHGLVDVFRGKRLQFAYTLREPFPVAPNDAFGFGLAIFDGPGKDSSLAIGPGNAIDGHVYIYDGGEGRLIETLNSPHAPDGAFGIAVAAETERRGTRIAVGAAPPDFTSAGGAAYVFASDKRW